nr:hypothetical protein [Tanacetum cinerariifolium]
MSSFYEFICYGCGVPSDTPLCYLCTCEYCGNILIDGACLECNSGAEDSFTYDPIPKSFNEVQSISNPPPQSHYNIYLCQICENNSHYGYECSVENLVPNPSESEDLSDRKCDVPVCDDFTKFSNLLFDVDDDFSSSDNESFSDKDISKEIYSNPLFDEQIVSMKIDLHHFNAEYDLIESLLNHDSSIIYPSSKIDSLLDEFVGELILLKTIPPRIDETDCDPEEEIRLIEKLVYDNSSPRPPEEFIFENSDAAIKSFSPHPIPLRIVTLLWKKLIYILLRMNRCHRALRKMTMTLKGIFSSLKNCLAMILFHFLKTSHFILIFHYPLVLLQTTR